VRKKQVRIPDGGLYFRQLDKIADVCLKRDRAFEKVVHDWYTDRWNKHYCKLNEPGWGIAEDLVKLFRQLDVIDDSDVTPAMLRGALKKLIKKEKA
jgi:hypothetical protein